MEYDTNCSKCGGLIMSPNKAYGYAGPVCYCMWKQAEPMNMKDIDYDRLREIVREELYAIKKDNKNETK